MEKKIICKSCAAEFSEKLPKCPYCETMNYKGAEAEYLKKLEAVRTDMESLEEIPKKAQKKELRKQIHFWLKVIVGVMLVIGLLFGFIYWQESRYDRDERADFLWVQKNVPMLDALYDKEAYTQLQDLYYAYEEDAPVWKWEHYDFLSIYNQIDWAGETLQRQKAGYEPDEAEYVSLFYTLWVIKGIDYKEGIDGEEIARLEQLSGDIRSDLEACFDMREEEQKLFEEKLQEYFGFVPFDDCERYIKEWYSKK